MNFIKLFEKYLEEYKISAESMTTIFLFFEKIYDEIMEEAIEIGDIGFLVKEYTSLSNAIERDIFTEKLQQKAVNYLNWLNDKIGMLMRLEEDVDYLDDLFNIRK